jgi:hypothetical protein
MLEATAAELESCKAEVAIKSADLQALGAALSQAEEQFSAATAAAAAADAAAKATIAALEVCNTLPTNLPSTPAPTRIMTAFPFLFRLK